MWNLTAAETVAVLPMAVPAVVACLLPIAALDKDQESMKIVRAILFGMTLIALLGTFFLVAKLWNIHLQPQYSQITLDFLSQFAAIFVLVCASMTVMQLWDHLHQEGWVKGETLSLLMFSVTGMILFASTTHLIVLFLALELLSIPLYALTATVRQRPQSVEGGVKYFMMGAAASACMLMGIVLLYGLTGSFDLKGVVSALGNQVPEPLFMAAIALLAVGFFFKISAVPFHQWTPDVYEAAPHPVAAFMSVATKGVAFIALLRVFSFALTRNAVVAGKWQWIAGFLAVLTLILGNLTALAQDNVKRMLAYSSISHAGYMLLAFVPGTQQAQGGLLFYLLAYLAMNMGAFGMFTAFGLVGENTRYGDLQGLGWKRPSLGVPIALCMISLAGLPPMGGFFGKYMIFKELIQTGHVGLALVGITASLVSVYFYMRVVIALFTVPPKEEKNESLVNCGHEIPEASLTNASIFVCGLISVAMGFAQYFLVDGFAMRAIRESMQFGP